MEIQAFGYLGVGSPKLDDWACFDAGPKVLRLLDRARDWKAGLTSRFDRYVEGWAETDLDKILDATAPGYRFVDPLVGSFSGRSLYAYFDLLQERFSYGRAVSRCELAFFLRGPMERQSSSGGLQLWREAPRIGLTGVAEIEIGEQGVIAERVAYDPNLASDILRRAWSDRSRHPTMMQRQLGDQMLQKGGAVSAATAESGEIPPPREHDRGASWT